MIDFSWREDLSESFGKVKRPVAEIFIKDKEGSWRALTMIIDSGADASVMNRSFGELFGHDIAKGRRIRMKGFGEGEIIAYVHTMMLKIGEHEIEAKVAITDIEKGPNVLGRKDIFNAFEIQFKNLEECTRFLRQNK